MVTGVERMFTLKFVVPNQSSRRVAYVQNNDRIQKLVLVRSYGQNDRPSVWYKFQAADIFILEKKVHDPHPKTVHLRAV